MDNLLKARALKKSKSFSEHKILGPVKDLEKHVHPEWWKSIFNPLYLKTDGDVVNDPVITEKEIDSFLKILNLKKEDKILDLCCGHGRHSLELARRGLKNVEGLDLSHYLIKKAKADAKKKNLNVKFKQGDARKLPFPPDHFDVVLILGNSFGYFEIADEDQKILKEVFRVLKPSGKILIDISDGNYLKSNFTARSWEWIDEHHFVCRERMLSKDAQRLISREVITHTEKGVIEDQFYAERLYTQQSMTELLRSVGFSDVFFHGTITTDSQRNQDLGMMARRLIVTGVVLKDWTFVKQKNHPTLKNVAVVMGDAKIADPLKPSGIFDEDDHYTINQLKEALSSLQGYKFTYVESHATLIQDLMRLKGKIDFVFNLCDEGFLNDPNKELHVPALLEMLGIPYSGSSPKCLAYCYDKSLIRGIAKEMGIPVAKGIFINLDDARSFELPFSFPCIVKPNFGDSSFGVTQKSVVYTLEELLNSISELQKKFGYCKSILVEEFLTGPEVTFGVIGNNSSDLNILPIIEEDFSALPDHLPKICGYEAKWEADSPYCLLRPKLIHLPEAIEKLIIESSLKLFKRVECQDYARFDWRLDGYGNPKLLEINPNPGWCWDGHLAKMAKYAGFSYAAMIECIIKATEMRCSFKKLTSN